MAKDAAKAIINTVDNYRREAENARRDRINLNEKNFDFYHMKQDWSHKEEGQSREFLSKQAMSVEQISSFMQQGLVDLADWFMVEKRPGVDSKFGEDEIRKILKDYLERSDFYTFVGDAVKSGLLGSLMIAKVGGKMVDTPKFRAVDDESTGSLKKSLIKIEDKRWELEISLVRQEDYYPDPTGNGLYEMQDIWMDLWQVKRLSEGPNAIFDKKVVAMVESSTEEDFDEQHKKVREQGQNVSPQHTRKRVKITEVWGNIIDDKTGELLYENVVLAIANDKHLIRKPTPNPFWHGKSPFVVSPIVRVPNSVWHKSLMDGPTHMNKALNELYNLILDGGMMAVHGIKQIRKDWLDDETQVENGIAPGTTLEVTNAMPVGAKVLERVDTSTVPTDGINVFQLTNTEFNQAALTNDLRLGQLPGRAVKATEVVEASQNITSVFTAVAKNIEFKFITEILMKSWMTIAQNADKLDSDNVISMLGLQRVSELSQISPEERFADTVNGFKFKVSGISQILDRTRDFRKLTSFLQTIFSNEILAEEYVKNFEVTALMQEIMRSLGISPDKVALKPEVAALNQQGADVGALGTAAQDQTQVQSPESITLEEAFGGIPRSDFANRPMETQQIRGEPA